MPFSEILPIYIRNVVQISIVQETWLQNNDRYLHDLPHIFNQISLHSEYVAKVMVSIDS